MMYIYILNGRKVDPVALHEALLSWLRVALGTVNHVRLVCFSNAYRSMFRGRFIRGASSWLENWSVASGARNFCSHSELPMEKSRLVQGVFSSVAPAYDLMNDCMSLGLHRVWKDHFVRRLRPVSGMRIVDVAAGTGDIAFRIWQREPRVSLTLLDPNEEMLSIARRRAAALLGRSRFSDSDHGEELAPGPATSTRSQPAGVAGTMRFIVAAAERLPLPDALFDAYTISFGMRNTSEPLRAMQESYRVLRQGGRFLMMEFARVRETFPLVQQLYDAYSINVIPWLGERIARDRHAYEYLVESIRAFPDQDEVCAMLERSGFREVTFEDLGFGMVSIYSGWKLE